MKEMSFEKAMEKLEKIVSDLEDGDLSLDESLKKYEEGICKKNTVNPLTE